MEICGTKPVHNNNNNNKKKPRPKFSRTYYKLRAKKRCILSAIKKAKKSNNIAILKKLKYQKRALLRRISRRKKAEAEIHKAKRTYQSQKAFNDNPHRYAKKIFSSQTKGEPTFDKETCENHFRKTYTDTNRTKIYNPPPGLSKPTAPKINFDTLIPSKKRFMEILKKRPNKSAPGPNGIPYLVYKKIPCCADILYTITCRILKEGIIPPK